MEKSIFYAILLISSIISSDLSLFASTANGVIDYLPHDQSLLDNPHWDILVVTIDEIENENTTNKNPPKGRFTVEEVLRGRIKQSTINLIWRPSNQPADHKKWEEGDGTKVSEWYRRPFNKEYFSQPLSAPRKGEKLIVFTLERKDLPGINAEVVDVYRFTPENKQTVLDNMAPSERSEAIQLPLFLLILLIPIVCLISLIVSFTKSVNLNKKMKVNFFVISLSVIVFLIYAFYEFGISNWTNIRVDLLLIYPLLLINTVVLIVAIIQLIIIYMKKKANKRSHLTEAGGA